MVRSARHEFTDYWDTAEAPDRPDPEPYPDPEPEPPAQPPPPQIGLPGTVGSGKTKWMIQRVKDVLAADPAAVCVVFVRDHALAQDIAPRLRDELGPSVPVGIWRGHARPDPDAPPDTDQRMCQRHVDVPAVSEAGGKITDLCGSKKRGFCRFHPGAGGTCGYVAQGQARHRVWMLTHAMLGRAAPPALMRYIKDDAGKRVAVPAADLVLIDEAFWSAMLGGFDAKPYAVDLAELVWPGWAAAVPDKPDKPDEPGKLRPTGAAAARRLMGVLAALHGVLAGAVPGIGIDKAALEGGGLIEASCHEARRIALDCKKKMPATLPATAPGATAGALGAAADNRRVMRVAKLLKAAADVLGERTGPAALRMIQDKAGVRRAALRWRDGIHPHWLEAPRGIIHADATMEEAMAKVWLSGLDVQRMPPISAPHMRVFQVEDKTLGYSAIQKSGNQGPDGQNAAEANARRVGRAIGELSVRYKGKGARGGPDVLAVLPLELERELAKAGLPPNVGKLHFGKLRGQDSFKHVAAQVVVSRPLPGPAAVEDMAEIIFGRGVDRLPPGTFYPKRDVPRVMADGTAREAQTVYHPDPRAEAVRWACCEAELVQAIGRGRGIHRTAANPLDVLVLTNVPLDDVPVSEVCTLDDVWKGLAGESPVLELLKAGVLPLGWPGMGAAMAKLGFFRRGANLSEAARDWFRRDRGQEAALRSVRREAEDGTPEPKAGFFSYRYFIGEKPGFRAPASWTRFTCRQPGRRRSQTVLVWPGHLDPRAAVEAVLGPLDRFAPASALAVSTPGPAALPAAPAPACDPSPFPVAAVSEPQPPIPVQEDAPVTPPVFEAPTPGSAETPEAVGEGAATDAIEAQIAGTLVSLPAVFAELVRGGAIVTTHSLAADRHR